MMKAAILKDFGSPLVIENLPYPVPGTGEVIVDVVAAPVLSYMNEVLSGKRQYLLKTPVAPGGGAIGRVRATGPDATNLKAGDWVLCDPTIRSRDNILSPDITLQGLSARGEGGLKLQQYFHHGSFAEQMLVPTENAFRLDSFKEADAGYGVLLALYWFLTEAYLLQNCSPEKPFWLAGQPETLAALPLRSPLPWVRAA